MHKNKKLIKLLNCESKNVTFLHESIHIIAFLWLCDTIRTDK